MSKQRFTSSNIVEGNHSIEFYFQKDGRQLRLSIRKGDKSEYVQIEECNDEGYIFNSSKKIDVKQFNDIMELAGGIFFEICEFTNNLMNTL